MVSAIRRDDGNLGCVRVARHRAEDLRHAAAAFVLSQGFTLEDVKNLPGESAEHLTECLRASLTYR